MDTQEVKVEGAETVAEMPAEETTPQMPAEEVAPEGTPAQ